MTTLITLTTDFLFVFHLMHVMAVNFWSKCFWLARGRVSVWLRLIFLFRGETEADWALIADPSCDC